MMTMEFDLTLLNAEWAKDCGIDELDLVSSIRAVPPLHAKWIQMLSMAKVKLRASQSKYNSLRQLKFKYFRGEMTKVELTNLGWEQWQGTKPMKSDMNEFLQGDADLIKYEDRIAYMEIIVSTLEAIVRSINSRGYDLKTLLAAKQFYNGSN